MAAGNSQVSTIVLPETLTNKLDVIVEEKKRREITEKIEATLIKYWKDVPKNKLLKSINEEFGTKICRSTMYDKARELGLLDD